ncbi:hypothetical protein EDB80DRAFT_702859 [Ilyonectria destructans]|nr:hypothetical protein EDB80DRAFT_702859 [Ilyonectria destructans]
MLRQSTKPLARLLTFRSAATLQPLCSGLWGPRRRHQHHDKFKRHRACFESSEPRLLHTYPRQPGTKAWRDETTRAL